jgi:hypothetical protein
VWPVIVIALVATRARLRWITVVAVAGALGSAYLMRTLAIRGNVPFDTDSSRLYYGTDTHASALLLGAAAAAVLAGLTGSSGRRVVSLPAIARHLIDIAALAGLLALGWSMYAVSYYTPALYRGGFLAFAAISALVVAIVSAPGGWLGRALDFAPLRWIGERSYGLYLWHWPVFVYTRPGLDWQLQGSAALGVRLAIVAVLTELSYRFVEVPLRRGGVVSTARGMRSWRVVAPVLGAVLGVVGVVGATTFVSTRISQYSRSGARHVAAAPAGTGAVGADGAVSHAGTLGPVIPGGTGGSDGVAVGALRPAASAGSSPAGGRSSSAPVSEPSPSLPSSASQSPTGGTPVAMQPTGGPTHPAAAPSAATPARGYPTLPPPIATGAPPALSAVGDSVMLDAASTLKLVCPGTEVYAVVGWQAKSVFGELDALRAAGHLGADVVIETGTNGIVSPKELDAELTALADRAKVIVINNHMARPWEPSNNAMFPVVVKAHPNAVLVNWDDAANAHPDWLSKDGVHIKTPGRGPYAQLIKTAAGC